VREQKLPPHFFCQNSEGRLAVGRLPGSGVPPTLKQMALSMVEKQGNCGGNQEHIRQLPIKGTTATTRLWERDKF